MSASTLMKGLNSLTPSSIHDVPPATELELVPLREGQPPPRSSDPSGRTATATELSRPSGRDSHWP